MLPTPAPCCYLDRVPQPLCRRLEESWAIGGGTRSLCGHSLHLQHAVLREVMGEAIQGGQSALDTVLIEGPIRQAALSKTGILLGPQHDLPVCILYE